MILNGHHEIPTFLEETMPVEMLARLESWQQDGRSLHLTVGTHYYKPVLYDYYGTTCETVWQAPGPGTAVSVQLDFLTAGIIRIRSFPGAQVPVNETPMVVGEFPTPVSLEVMETPAQIVVTSAEVRLYIIRDPWQLRMFDLQGQLLWETRPIDIPALDRPPQEEQWNPPQQRWIFLHRYAYPWGRVVERAQRTAVCLVWLGT
jgi:alpha-D-xyloside xylohydrolase